MKANRLPIYVRISISIIVFHFITLLFLLLYFAYQTGGNSYGTVPESEVESIINRIGYDSDGSLADLGSQASEKAKGERSLWFAVEDEKGNRLESGSIPSLFRPVINNLGVFGGSELNSKDGSPELSFRITVRSFGPHTLHVITGGVPVSGISASFKRLFSLVTYSIFVPLACATALVVPLITRNIMSGISEAVMDARRIRKDDRNGRLREENVPFDILPLVQAVNDALERLSQGYEERDRFLASAAHELRAPIAILDARVSMLSDDESRRVLTSDVARLSNLAESLLDIQRLSLKPSSFAPADIRSIVRQTVADLAPLIISAGYEPEFISPSEPVMVNADVFSLSRAVTNLIQNAIIHAGGRGSIRVIVNSKAVISVQDEGPGIARHERKRIFEPFYRITPRDQGSGLGLHLVSEIVRLHHGHIEVGEGCQGGAMFEISLPRIS